MKKLRVGVIGVGSMGKNHVRIYSELPNVELIGVSDIDKRSANEIASKFSCKSFSDYRDLLKEINAVSIASPTLTHYEIALESISSGVHMLIEKPFTGYADEASDIIEKAKIKNLAVHVGFVDRYNHAVIRLRELIKGKKIIAIEFRRLSPPIARASDVSVVSDLMIHDIEHAIALASSEAIEINAAGIYSYASANIKFKNGIIATLTDSKATYNKVRQINVTCDDSYYNADLFKNEITVSEIAKGSKGKQYIDFADLTTKTVTCSGEEPLKAEIKDFVNCLASQDKSKFYNNEILNILKIASVIDKSCLSQ